MAAPIVIWDWLRSGHVALELAMAATAWLFGLRHFSHDHYLAWPSLIGAALFVAYWMLSGLTFTRLADRVFGITRPASSIGAGFAWGLVNFIFFWEMLLPIARDGAPFRAAPGRAALFVAPNWTWVLGFTLLGLVTGACYAALRQTPPARDETRSERELARATFRRAA